MRRWLRILTCEPPVTSEDVDVHSVPNVRGTCNFANTPLLGILSLVLYTVRVNSKRHFCRACPTTTGLRGFSGEHRGFTVAAFHLLLRGVAGPAQLQGTRGDERGIGQGSSRTEWSQCSSCPGNIGSATIPWLHMFLAIKQSSR